MEINDVDKPKTVTIKRKRQANPPEQAKTKRKYQKRVKVVEDTGPVQEVTLLPDAFSSVNGPTGNLQEEESILDVKKTVTIKRKKSIKQPEQAKTKRKYQKRVKVVEDTEPMREVTLLPDANEPRQEAPMMLNTTGPMREQAGLADASQKTEVAVRKPRLKRTTQQIKIDVHEENDSRPETSFLPANVQLRPQAELAPAPVHLGPSAGSVDDDMDDMLYPQIGDSEFSYKLAKHKEFFDTQYDGTLTDIKARANQLCNTEFELMPHQLFVRNFLSVQTPYNGLLLYMGLGSGKTCSAIGIAEEMRLYMKQSGLDQEKKINKTLFIAAPNVQDNFLVQLFNEDKLVEENGTWNIESCVGNKLIREVNPTHVKGLSKTTLANNIRRVIDKYYSLMGYSQFANYAEKVIYGENDEYKGNKEREIANIKEHFNNRLLIIDEVHNIRADDQEQDKTKVKAVSKTLFYIVENAENLRLVLLSATPMYNSYQEIIWITNLLNVNDKRPKIKEEDVFDRKGNFTENGKELLQSKLYGYVSYVRGENPYTFPYRLYPSTFAPEHSKQFTIPTVTFTKKPILEKNMLSFLDIYGSKFPENSYQQITYKLLVNVLQGEYRQEDEQKSNFGYSALIAPLQALNIVYPSLTYDVYDAKTPPSVQDFIGSSGLNATFSYTTDDNAIYDFEYKVPVLEKFGRILSQENLPKYGSKISTIVNSIAKSTGISLVYSQYIDGGLVPLALALEEMGYTKYDGRSLFKEAPVDSNKQKYVMITGNLLYSRDNVAALKAINSEKNKYGDQIKVVLISFAGSEGLDYKNIRQIHIMDPWYNMNRLEQIIGRGVRNLSHCNLPFEDRNVEIYLHTMYMTDDPTQECIDMYMYRLSEKKAIQIGNVTRVMKQIAVDCLLNIKQHSLTVENLQTIPENNLIEIKPSSWTTTTKFAVGDKAYSNTCDYLESCELQCIPNKPVTQDNVHKNTYTQYFVESNQERISQLIKQLFKEQTFYKRRQIIQYVNAVKQYPIEQIYSTITYMVNNKNEQLIDKYGRLGLLINNGDIYAFQPIEINNKHISIYDRTIPIQVKHKKVEMRLGKVIDESELHESSTIDNVNSDITYKVAEEQGVTDNPIQIIEQNILKVFDTSPLRPRSEWDFYNYMRNALEQLKSIHFLNDNLLREYIVEHSLEAMEHAFVLDALRMSFFYEGTSDVMNHVKKYFHKNSTQYLDIPCVPIADGKGIIFYLYMKDTQEWKENKGMKELGKNFYKNLESNKANKFIGFYQAGIFRIKDLSNKRTKFAVVNQKGKAELLSILNEICEMQKVGIQYPQVKLLDQTSISIILEMILRFYHKQHFLTPVEAIESI